MKAPAYPMYAQDFDMDTKDWTALEVGIYIRLLNYEWVNGGVPIEPARIARIAGIDPRTCRRLLPVVLTKFGIDEQAKMYVNRRLEEERELQHKYRELQSLKGKLSAEKRQNEVNHGSTTVQPEYQPKVNSSSSSSSSSSLKEESTSKDKTKTSLRATPKPGVSPDVKTFIDYAFVTFQSMYQEKLMIDGGKDGKTVKALLGTYGLERLKRLWDDFLSSQDEFIIQAGKSIGVFKTQINKLISGNNGAPIVTKKTSGNWALLKEVQEGKIRPLGED